MAYWLQTYTGKAVDVLDPTPEMISIEDIAHSLSMLCRFGGHCRDFYSVAEHSLLVESLNSRCPADTRNDFLFVRFPADIRNDCFFLTYGRRRHNDELQSDLACLLHDAAEAYTGDIATPIKQGLMRLSTSFAVEELETRWLRAIGQRFGLGDRLVSMSESVRGADALALSIEVPALFSSVQEGWWVGRKRPDARDLHLISCWSPSEARRKFLSRFHELNEALHGAPSWGETKGAT